MSGEGQPCRIPAASTMCYRKLGTPQGLCVSEQRAGDEGHHQDGHVVDEDRSDGHGEKG